MPVRMICVLLAALLVSVSSVSADPLAVLRHCNRNPSLPTEYGHVTLRLPPISTIQVPLTAAKVPFAAAIGEYDVLSIASNYALNERVSSFDPIIRHPHTPDTFVFVRGSEIVVFPRVLMLAPQVSLSTVRSNDIIASLFFEPKDKDRLREDLGMKVATSRNENILINVTGPLLTDDQRCQVVIDKTIINAVIFHKLHPFGSTIESSIHERSGTSLARKVPVTVVSRKLGTSTVRFVSPLRQSGIYADQSPLMKRLRPYDEKGQPSDTINPWDKLFKDRLGVVSLKNGDVISYTLLELVPPFHDLAVR